MTGDSAKAERFLRRLEPLQGALEAYCRKVLNDPAGVEDVLQNTVLDAFRDFHLYAEGTNFRAWIFRYLNLKVFEFNRRRARVRTESLPEEIPAPTSPEMLAADRVFEAILESPDTVLEQCDEAISQALRSLSEQEQAVLLLRAIGEFKYREIADVLGVPAGTVMSCLSRVRVRLREQLTEHCRRQGLLPGDA
ncbi:MAG: sigma-70 family RNA polymerase sigma factor [Planctomycetes bacterium]|nr:sigma-70 family RNA polymerase sigma factor [Planctomycetota bacterium]